MRPACVSLKHCQGLGLVSAGHVTFRFPLVLHALSFSPDTIRPLLPFW